MTLAIPVVLSMMVTLVYNTVDTYFIAHIGNTSMVAGVAIATPVFTVMIAPRQRHSARQRRLPLPRTHA